MRSLAFIVLAALGGGLWACSSDTPCTQCAPVEGTYSLTLDANTATSSGTCSGVSQLTSGGLVVSGSGSKLSGSFLNVSLSGTLYQSDKVVLSGTYDGAGFASDGGIANDNDTYQFNLRYVAPTNNGPTTLVGSVQVLSSRPNAQASTDICTQTADVTATR